MASPPLTLPPSLPRPPQESGRGGEQVTALRSQPPKCMFPHTNNTAPRKRRRYTCAWLIQYDDMNSTEKFSPWSGMPWVTMRRCTDKTWPNTTGNDHAVWTRHNSPLLGETHETKPGQQCHYIHHRAFLFPLSKSSGLSSLSCPIQKDEAIETNVERQRTVQGSQLSSISSSITPARGLNPQVFVLHYR